MPSSPLTRIALVGDRYNHDEPAHPQVEKLLPELGYHYEWVPTTDITATTDLGGYDALWVVPGGPYKSQQGVNRAICYARTSGTPYFGTCGGYFGGILEYAQNVLKIPDVVDLGDALDTIGHLILPKSCSVEPNRRVRLTLSPGSRLSVIYGSTEVDELLQCEDGFVRDFMDAAGSAELHYTAVDPLGSARALEIDDHPFFLGCLFQPEMSSTAESVHPIVAAFLTAADESATRRRRAPETAGKPS